MVGHHVQINSDFKINVSGLLVEFWRISCFYRAEMLWQLFIN